MIMHVYHKSDLSEGSDEFAHFARIQKVLPEGVRLWQRFFCCFFLVDEGRDCRTNDGPTFNAGLVTLWFFQEIHTSIARKPFSFVIFQGGGVQTPCPPSESAHAHTHSLGPDPMPPLWIRPCAYAQSRQSLYCLFTEGSGYAS